MWLLYVELRWFWLPIKWDKWLLLMVMIFMLRMFLWRLYRFWEDTYFLYCFLGWFIRLILVLLLIVALWLLLLFIRIFLWWYNNIFPLLLFIQSPYMHRIHDSHPGRMTFGCKLFMRMWSSDSPLDCSISISASFLRQTTVQWPLMVISYRLVGLSLPVARWTKCYRTAHSINISRMSLWLLVFLLLFVMLVVLWRA